MNRMEKIAKTLLGHYPHYIDIMIITPISSIYNSILDQFPDKTESKGYYSNAVIEGRNGKKCLIVCIPQGIQGQDICWATLSCKIFFLGYGGGISAISEIGEIFEVENAFTDEGKSYPLTVTGRFTKVICGYSPSMLGAIAKISCLNSKSRGCDVVDMETAYCAAAAAENQHCFTSWLLITDKPGNRNFWDINNEERERISQGKRKLMENVLCICQEMLIGK